MVVSIEEFALVFEKIASASKALNDELNALVTATQAAAASGDSQTIARSVCRRELLASMMTATAAIDGLLDELQQSRGAHLIEGLAS